MPTLRLLANNAMALGSAGQFDPISGAPAFPVPAGSTIKLTLDTTGWGTLSSIAWTGDLTAASTGGTGNIRYATFAIPAADSTIPDLATPTRNKVTATVTGSPETRVVDIWLVS